MDKGKFTPRSFNSNDYTLKDKGFRPISTPPGLCKIRIQNVDVIDCLCTSDGLVILDVIDQLYTSDGLVILDVIDQLCISDGLVILDVIHRLCTSDKSKVHTYLSDIYAVYYYIHN